MLIALAILALVAAGSAPPAHAHCQGKHSPPHPHCDDDPPYQVFVSGDLVPKAGEPAFYDGEDGGGRSKPVQVYFQFLDLDLSFFKTFPTVPSLQPCFPESTPVAGELTALVISEEREGSALAQFWFTAYGRDGTTPVDYQLLMWGDFAGTWRPGTNESTTVELMQWQMRTTTRKDKGVACRLGENFANGVTIEVSRTN